ncbi:DUF5694 domain-containing protein [Portibacter lacus]|uniref:TraB/GumN family protein n=1 Tax=Portibacter lacus TaxID=1099794 RepID=A0AA37SVL4_9BACT|nr:DUF5694 domain-containing protein [Portibacter lacus]GLR18605.1 hypothetical protein GCM10007940_32210 [Portibacter lacus]
MKVLLKILALILIVNISTASAQSKEVVIVGTMHQVPDIIKNAYKPMFKKVKKYEPQAIYVEYVPGSDLESVAFDTPEFLQLSDSIAENYKLDQCVIDELNKKPLDQFSTADFTAMKTYYTAKRDYANTRYFTFLEKYGIDGPKKPKGNENGDISFKLASHQGMKYLHSMDYQASNQYYYKYWRACDSTYIVSGKMQDIAKQNKKRYRMEVVGTLLRGNARNTNRLKTLEQYHKSNTLHYVESPEEVCVEGGKWWDFRNEKMAKNIGDQVLRSDNERNLVVVGAGHVVGIKAELEKNYPNLIVRTLYK